ncbi:MULTISPECIES: DUF6325 family protein [unclassified Streptomyces]|uniref:DUF6325 family protein n=1 Tax=unclassified Streptomyces TaxID=2593676 RepID=UPI002DDA6773|nr:DUF6325 family protein [Streptomyces sp. NBC_00243]WRZ20651.1 DUF6325 family protein [Streptomyces sp. NBC_00243]WTB39224.1 DUF6325 family protein [Streptomyces sp. NBC_00827]
MDVGPVEYVVVAFPGNRFRGEIAPELRALVANGTVRILDLTFIKKDADGVVSYIELDALDPMEASVFDDIEGEVGGLFSHEDLELIADELVPDSSAAVLLWEDTWAAGISGAVRRAGGQLVAHERIPAEAVERAYQDAA